MAATAKSLVRERRGGSGESSSIGAAVNGSSGSNSGLDSAAVRDSSNCPNWRDFGQRLRTEQIGDVVNGLNGAARDGRRLLFFFLVLPGFDLLERRRRREIVDAERRTGAIEPGRRLERLERLQLRLRSGRCEGLGPRRGRRVERGMPRRERRLHRLDPRRRRSFEQRIAVARQERLERHRCGDVHRIVGDQLLERRHGFGRRCERAADVHLEGARQPRAQRRRQRLFLAERRALARFVQQRGNAMGELVGLERTAQDQRQRDEAHPGHVRAMIEARQAGARRHGDPEILPQPIAAELQLLDRGAQHVLGDDEPRVRCHDEPLGRQQAVRDVARVLVQHRNRGHELANQAQRRVDVELQAALVRDAQDVGEPRALDVVRHNRQGRDGRHAAVDAAHARVVGVAEIRKARGALAQRELERRHGEQRRSQPENLQQLPSRAVGRDHALADTVGEERGFGVIAGRKTGHDDAYSATPDPLGRVRKKRRKSLSDSESGRLARSEPGRRRLQHCQRT